MSMSWKLFLPKGATCSLSFDQRSISWGTGELSYFHLPLPWQTLSLIVYVGNEEMGTLQDLLMDPYLRQVGKKRIGIIKGVHFSFYPFAGYAERATTIQASKQWRYFDQPDQLGSQSK